MDVQLQLESSLPTLKYAMEPDISEFILYQCVPTQVHGPLYMRPEYVCTSTHLPVSDMKSGDRLIAVPKRIPDAWRPAYLKKELMPIVRVSEPTDKSRNSS